MEPILRIQLRPLRYQRSILALNYIGTSKSGAGGDNRSLGLRVTNAVLCHLSYTSNYLLYGASARVRTGTGRIQIDGPAS
jgi:hypothetical protein